MFSTNYLGRFIDLFPHGTGSGSDGGSGGPLYAHACAPCGPPDTDAGRLIDLVANPDFGSAGEAPYAPVYAQVTACQKDWVGAEAYVTYAMGLGHGRKLSREMTLRLDGMDDCTTDGSSCVYVPLIYNAGSGKWEGSVALNAGAATFQVFGTFDGVREHWFLTLGGCPANGTQELGVLCDFPLRLVGTGGGGPFGSACCAAVPPPSPLYVWAKIPPLYLARLVDVTAEGSGSGSGPARGSDGVPVYLAAECCDDGCPFNPGCCAGVPIDARLAFTVFNIVQTAGTCHRACAGATVGPTTADGCVIWSVTTCAGPNTICLVCDQAASAAAGTRGWQHYRILAGGVLYPPASGSCNPFSVTFDNLPWSSPDPGGNCSGTYSVTVTRP